MTGLGDPLVNGTFRFTKGTSKDFEYKNLSAGEKAAFDLLLDLIVKKKEFNDTVFCIDEPEAHMGSKLQGKLLTELYKATPDNCQLWIGTHSIGMMRAARDLAEKNPEKVVFLDFEREFDKKQTLEPVTPDREFWGRVLKVALDDLADLVAPKHVVICEGDPNTPASGKKAGFDAECYDKIFQHEFPDTKFLSGGDASSVEKDRLALGAGLKVLIGGIQISKLIDRDDRNPAEVSQLRKDGTQVLNKRNIESYLFDDEVLMKLCEMQGKPEVAIELIARKRKAVADAQSRGYRVDDLKGPSRDIFIAARDLLKLPDAGSTADVFMRDVLAPVIVRGMAVYDDLKACIFSKSAP